MEVKLLCFFIFLRLTLGEPLRGRIVGGSIAESDQFPYQAAIIQLNRDFVCSGFIVNEFYIGTTAFCVKDFLPNQLEALLGSNSLTRGGWLFRITQITLHDAFEATLHLNDVAVIRTNVPIRASPRIRSIVLASNFLNPGSTVIISGFGKNSHLHNEVAADIHFIRKQVITNSDCSSRLIQNGENPNVVFGNNFCTFNGIGQGTCTGDAGSPVVMNNQLVGIVSWDTFCGLGSPDIHIRISNFRSWFIENSQD
jgi:trypsin